MKKRVMKRIYGCAIVLIMLMGSGCGGNQMTTAKDTTETTRTENTAIGLTNASASDRTQTESPTPAATSANPQEAAEKGPKLTMLGRASVKIVLEDGRVVYIDPYAGKKEDYADPADLVLVTHQHSDHNAVSKVTLKEDGEVIQCPKDIQAGDGKTTHGIDILAVPAYNKNHPRESGCGFVLTMDDVVLYHSGDTSNIDEMDALKDLKIDWALLCIDGVYNMGPAEAMLAAERIGAANVIPMHSDGSMDYSQKNVDAFTASAKVELKTGETVLLIK